MSAKPLIGRVRVRGFRSAADVAFAPGRMCALVGGSRAGKSNLLWALDALLQAGAARLDPADVTTGLRRIEVRADLSDGRSVSLEAQPPGRPRADGGERPPSLMLPSALRAGSLVASRPDAGGPLGHALEFLGGALREQLGDGEAGPAASLVDALENCCIHGVAGLVVLIEEPELHLRPHAQRYLYRVLRRLADGGNQVIYSTHSPAFLDVARLDEAAFVRKREGRTSVVQPAAITPSDDFRVLTEFDVSRSELLLARTALLVEGLTEKLTFPYVFEALGYDPDREGISIVACGGKSNIPLFARAASAASVPSVVVHDRDAAAGRRPNRAMRELNAEIDRLTAPAGAIVLEPDFEAIAGLRGHSHKPERAWRTFRGLDREQMPAPLVAAVERAVALARADRPG